jgi:hypothetical protein
LAPGRDFALGEKTTTQYLELDQVRKTHTVLGSQPSRWWGYEHGLNEHNLTIGCSCFETKLQCERPGLLGPDLVRLALERCRTARQAVDLIADLVERHGQGAFFGCSEEVAGDCGLLIADPREAFAVETSGPFWVHQEVRQVRAVTDLCIIRQDWDRIAHGLADAAIERGWWPGDGTKLDFAGALAASGPAPATEMRRWGRATLLLEEQNGHIDHAYLRRLLSDHFDGEADEVDPLEPRAGPIPLCRHGFPGARDVTVASYIAELPAEPTRLPLLWCGFGPPCSCVYFPIFLDGENPLIAKGDTLSSARRIANPTHLDNVSHPLGTVRRLQRLRAQTGANRECVALLHHNLDRLQAHLDQATESFVAEVAPLRKSNSLPELHRRIGLFMDHVRDQAEQVIGQLEETTRRLATRLEMASPF